MKTLESVPNKPKNFMNLLNYLLEEKDSKNAKAVYDSLSDFKEWVKVPAWPIRYMHDVEWAWIDGKSNIGEI